jgi:hypothetical protein
MNIQNSLEWNSIESTLLHRSAGSRHFCEIKKLIHNIGSEVSELSKAEVDSRSGRRHKATVLLASINANIDMVEGYILVAALVG